MIWNEFGHKYISVPVADFANHNNDEYDNRNKDPVAEYIVIHNQQL